MKFSFAIIGSTAATTERNVTERKNDGILSLDVKKLLILHLFWKTNRILQYGSFFFIMRLILVRIWRDNLPKYLSYLSSF